MRNFDYSYLKEMRWDGSLVRLLGKIHEYKGKFSQLDGVSELKLDRLTQIASIHSVESSNKIEGIVTTATRMKQLMTNNCQAQTRDEDEILGYKSVLQLIQNHCQEIPFESRYILQLHRDLLKQASVSYAGSYKSVQNYINQAQGDGSVATRFTPLSPRDTPEAVESLCQAYAQAIADEAIDELLIIPTCILDFLCIHPFMDGNGRISRLLTLLLLQQAGYTVGKYVSIERHIEQSKLSYYDALAQSGIAWHEGTNDPSPFIYYMLRVLLACYVELDEKLNPLPTGATLNTYEIVKKFTDEKLGPFNSQDVLEACPQVGRSSALAALKQLREEGEIVKTGKGRATYYIRKLS